MIISQSRDFVFVHIHKTAGEAITLALLPHLGQGDVALGSTTWGNLRNVWWSKTRGVSKHSSAASLRDYLGEETWKNAFSFAFVRHPYDRARSLYTYVRAMSDRREGRDWRNPLYSLPVLKSGDPRLWPVVAAYRETEDFSGFIRHPGFLADPGAACQKDMLTDGEGRMLVDFVGHFDRLEADFAHVTERLGLEGVRLPRHNVSISAKAELAADDRELLDRFYAPDFEAFGFAQGPVAAGQAST